MLVVGSMWLKRAQGSWETTERRGLGSPCPLQGPLLDLTSIGSHLVKVLPLPVVLQVGSKPLTSKPLGGQSPSKLTVGVLFLPPSVPPVRRPSSVSASVQGDASFNL